MSPEEFTIRPIIGLEVHVQLATRTKLFCACAVEFGAAPNSRTCPVCLGLPGALPVLNRRAFEHAVTLALALGCRIAPFTKWDRKSYYYPDLPKNYQISQYDLPLGAAGRFEVPVDGELRSIRIRRAHLEEDAGKNIHDVPGCSLVDLNRAGMPLLEIVTEPDLSSPQEAYAFAVELQRLVTTLGVGEGSMQKGQMRFEPNVNVEITAGGQVFVTPIVEIKNLNSFRAVRDAVAFEIRRQVADWQADPGYIKGRAPSENRGWNAERGITEFQRGKEAAHDYRYFPDPDLVPVTVTAEWVEQQRAALPELPVLRVRRLIAEHGLSESDADALVSVRGDADLFEAACALNPSLARRLAGLILGIGRKVANESDTHCSRLLPDAAAWAQLAGLVEGGQISASAAARLLEEVLHEPRAGVDFAELARAQNLGQVQDQGQVEAWVAQAFADNAAAVQDALGNPKKAKAVAGFMAGQVLRVSAGQADPKIVARLVAERLAELRKGKK